MCLTTNVATFREQGIAVEWDTWYGMVAPTNLPSKLLAKISTDMLSVMNDEEVRASMNNGHCAAPEWPGAHARGHVECDELEVAQFKGYGEALNDQTGEISMAALMSV